MRLIAALSMAALVGCNTRLEPPGLTTVHEQGSLIFSYAPPWLATNSAALNYAARGLCNRDLPDACIVHVWSDREIVPESLAAFDAVADDRIAAYSRNRSSGLDCFSTYERDRVAVQMPPGCETSLTKAGP